MLQKLYRTYISFLESLPAKQQYMKMYITERFALRRKKHLTNSVKWTDKQKKEFVDFWKANYRNIRSDGHKLFESFNGQFNVDYMPDFLFATKVESKLNSYKYSRIYSDKSLVEVLYKGKSEAIIPKTYLLKASGVFYDSKRRVIDKEQARDILLTLSDAVVKPIIDGNSGKGVIIGSFDSFGYDKKNEFDVFSLLDEYQDNYIVQEKIVQSRELSQLYSKAINTFRVITYISSSSIHVAPVVLRVGSGGGLIDNIHAGGLAVGVDIDNECLLKDAYKLGYSDSKIILQVHPDSGETFEGYKINGVNRVVEASKILHGHTPHIGIISWDFTLNKDNLPILIEANFTGQSAWFAQIVHGIPLFGDQTKKIIKLIR